MQILDVIETAQSGRAVANLGTTFGLSEAEARSVTEEVLPRLAVALEGNTLSRGGLADMVRALGDGHHEAILENPRAWQDPRVIADGRAILTHILGSEHKARILAARTQRATGVSGGIIEALLPILAQMLMGAISRYMRGGLGDVMSRLPLPRDEPSPGAGAGRDPWGGGSSHQTGGTMPDPSPGGFQLPGYEAPGEDGRPAPRSGRGGGFDLPPTDGSDAPWRNESVPGSSGGGFPLPKYQVPGGSGSTADDTWGGARPNDNRGVFPLPGPRPAGDNPYGDLSDVLRRGGRVDTSAGGGSLWTIIRNILGSALGFGGSGFFGWVLRFLVLRLGWPLLRRMIFGR